MSFIAPFPGANIVIETFLAHAEGGSGNPVTFSALSFGAAAANRFLVAAFTWIGSPAKTLSSCTIGGISATVVVSSGAGGATGQSAAIAIAAVPTGTSGNVVGTFSGSVANVAVALYSLSAIASATPTATASSNAANPTATINIGAGACLLAVAGAIGTSPSGSWTSPMTNDVNTTFGGGTACRTAASHVFPSAQTALVVTCTFTSSGSGAAGAFAVFSP